MCIFVSNGLGYISGDSFTKSSGHPDTGGCQEEGGDEEGPGCQGRQGADFTNLLFGQNYFGQMFSIELRLEIHLNRLDKH
jgi:hypothetical protein